MYHQFSFLKASLQLDQHVEYTLDTTSFQMLKTNCFLLPLAMFFLKLV